MQRIVLIIAAILVVGAGAYIGIYKPELIGLGGKPEPTPIDVTDSDADQMANPNEPLFDIVRISGDATAVVAGKAAPGSTVRLLRDGDVIAETIADANGEWVMTVIEPMPSGAARLTLEATTPTGEVFESSGAVVIAIPDGSGRALAVLMTPGDKSRVLQGVAEGDDRVLAVETIDYDENGNVIFAGRALPGNEVRIYLNNQLVGRATVSDEGMWRLTPDTQIDAGNYDLRADQVDQSGKVTARIALPFLRESIDRLVFSEGRVVVQPGNSLWRIANHVYGEGISYTLIYEANSDQIMDPDLIYPGQMFALPGSSRGNAQ